MMPLEKHVPNKGYCHNFKTDEDWLAHGQTDCMICQKPFRAHLERLEVFKTGGYQHLEYHYRGPFVNIQRKHRVHSFHEYEKIPLNEINREATDQKYRLKEAHRNLIQSDKKTFYCEICYSEANIDQIAILQQCGHYFCRTCLEDYYKYMVNVSGQVLKIKCPNQECRI